MQFSLNPEWTRLISQFLKECNGKPVSANGLRNGVYKALSKLPLQERVRLSKELIENLQKAGINVGSRLFLLGIPAAIPDELTPSDLGKLLRSVYINEPETMKAISQTLTKLLSPNARTKPVPQSTSSANKKRK